MPVFFTADCHFGHSKIIEYCDRPFSDCHRMNKTLVNNWNMRVKPSDTVFHVGDFCVKGRLKAVDWEDKLNGKIVHIRGNHDANNSVKVAVDRAVIHFSNRNWLLVHKPPACEEEIPVDCDAVICGHVHNRWAAEIRWGKPVINVGADVRRFMPVTKAEVETARWRVEQDS